MFFFLNKVTILNMIKFFYLKYNFFIILIFIILVFLSLLISEIIQKKNRNIEKEILRKIPHILIGIIFSFSPFFMLKREIIFFSCLLFLGIFWAKFFSFFKTIFLIQRNSVGIWLTPITLISMTFIWLPNNIISFLVGILVLTFSDAFGAIFGKIFGKKKFLFSEKTFLGSGIFFLTTFFIFLFFSKKIFFWKIFSISFFLTFLELILIFGLDNLFLPIFASYLFYWFF